jgi:3-oxoacyl-[acyl-carrier protein] reductase
MKERRWGRIVHLTSVSVKQPLSSLVLSNALRAAVAGLSKTLAEEYASFGITVNCVATGWTDTDRLGEIASAAAGARGVTPEDVRAGWIAAIPAGRLARAEEIADMTAFLASDRAAYVNGTVVAVDGGFCRGLL